MRSLAATAISPATLSPVDFYGKPRRFCGYEDLLAMKRTANRDQGRIDVNSLKQARREL
jgi:hypothetical protein